MGPVAVPKGADAIGATGVRDLGAQAGAPTWFEPPARALLSTQHADRNTNRSHRHDRLSPSAAVRRATRRSVTGRADPEAKVAWRMVKRSVPGAILPTGQSIIRIIPTCLMDNSTSHPPVPPAIRAMIVELRRSVPCLSPIGDNDRVTCTRSLIAPSVVAVSDPSVERGRRGRLLRRYPAPCRYILALKTTYVSAAIRQAATMP